MDESVIDNDFVFVSIGLSQYREQRIKIPSTPRYSRSAHGSDRGADLSDLHHTSCAVTWVMDVQIIVQIVFQDLCLTRIAAAPVW